MNDCCVIAVDGPAGSGKSSAARGAARALGLRFLDTGAMYRAVTWWLITHGLDPADQGTVARHVASPVLEVGTDPASPTMTVDGVDASAAIRTREVSNAVSAVASVPQVRAHLVALQQQIIARACAASHGIVAEGRDTGTVVAPGAAVKVFLTASEEVRARRRSAELSAEPAATAAVTRRELHRRDRHDAPQTAVAADAVTIDSTDMSLEDVIGLIVSMARPHVRPAGGDGCGTPGTPPRPEPADAAWTN